ncbi:hypothetical protein ACQB60_21750 [Actinomycetota bacterium Odt1-20B]
MTTFRDRDAADAPRLSVLKGEGRTPERDDAAPTARPSRWLRAVPEGNEEQVAAREEVRTGRVCLTFDY